MPVKGTVFKIPGDSYAKLLPLFYKLPVELVQLRPAYMKLSRKVRDLIGPGRISDQITSLQFAEFVWDCYAWTIWQCLEVPDRRGNYMKIPGNWVYYSGYFPLWKLCYVIANTMVEKLEGVERWNLQALFYFRSYEEIPWQDYEQFLCMVVYYTDLIIRENNWQPMIDEVWRHRQIEDYNGESVYKRDFMRSWTHRRSAEPPLYAVRRTLRAEFPDGKFDRDKLLTEYAQLQAKHKEISIKFKEVQTESRRLWSIKSNIESAIRNQEKQREQMPTKQTTKQKRKDDEAL